MSPADRFSPSIIRELHSLVTHPKWPPDRRRQFNYISSTRCWNGAIFNRSPLRSYLSLGSPRSKSLHQSWGRGCPKFNNGFENPCYLLKSPYFKIYSWQDYPYAMSTLKQEWFAPIFSWLDRQVENVWASVEVPGTPDQSIHVPCSYPFLRKRKGIFFQWHVRIREIRKRGSFFCLGFELLCINVFEL